MSDKLSEVFDAYDMEIFQTSRGRGAVLMRTSRGIRQLKPTDSNQSRIEAEYNFKELVSICGYDRLDRCVRNKDNELLSYDRYGVAYVLRCYFDGRECNTHDVDEILGATRNLTMLHKACRKAWELTDGDVHIRQTGNFKKRNQELKRVRNFISRYKARREFEQIYIKVFDKYYKVALDCEEKYGNLIIDKDNEHLGYCHGMYNNHSILVDEKNEFYTIGFDKFYVGNQLDDLYHFLRKMLEKNDYSIELMEMILEEYNKYCTLTKRDYEYIYTLFSYPEKFYKISNQYMNSSKNWISPKMLEKINAIIEDDEKKKRLLESMWQKYLNLRP